MVPLITYLLACKKNTGHKNNNNRLLLPTAHTIMLLLHMQINWNKIIKYIQYINNDKIIMINVNTLAYTCTKV